MADLILDDVASRALASIILEATADALAEGGVRADTALTQLADDTGLVLDVCAAVLYVTSWMAGAGGIDPAAIFAAAEAMKPDDTDTLEGAPQ